MLSIPTWFKGVLMLTATAIAWGGMFPVTKITLKSIDPITVTWIRFSFSTVILVFMLFLTEGKKVFRFEGQLLKLWWLGTLGFAGFGILLVKGVQITTPEHAAIIPALMPLIALTVIAIRTFTFPKFKSVISILLGIVGVTMVVTVGDLDIFLSGEVGSGELLIFCGAVFWVIYTIGATNFSHWSGLRYTTLTILLGTVSISLIELVALSMQWIDFPSYSTLMSSVPAFSYLVFAASVMGFIFWNSGMRVLGSEKGVLFINLVPVTAIAIAFYQGKHIDVWELLGIATVILALFLNSFSRQRNYN